MPKKLFVFFLIAVLILHGCSAIVEENTENPYKDIEYSVQELNLKKQININPVLYFLNESKTRLQAESRVITVPDYTLREEYVIKALLDGPISDELLPLGKDLEFDKVETLPDLINVYLTQNAYLSADEIICVKLALAATLSDFTNKKYVNIFFNNIQIPYKGIPTGLIQKSTNDLSEEIISLKDKAQANNPEIYAAIYYLDKSEKFLLPEERRLVFRDREYVNILFDQLIAGPQDYYSHKASVDNTIKLLDYSIEENSDGKDILKLKLNKEPIIYTTGFDRNLDGKTLALASITYTMLDFIPQISGIMIQIGEAETNDVIYTKDSFTNLLGGEITLYLPTGNTSSFLNPIERIISESESRNPEIILKELMSGPNVSDSITTYPAMPSGVSFDYVKEIYLADGMLVINFDGDILKDIGNISRENEFIMIYSIVNTLTSFEGIRSVQFLIDGERFNYLNEGVINLIDPIIKNPGVIKYNE